MRTEQQLREALAACARASGGDVMLPLISSSRPPCPFWEHGGTCCPEECNCADLMRWILGDPSPMSFTPADPSLPEKVQQLLQGKAVISREPGHSMEPLIKSRQPVRVHPVRWVDVVKDDIVLCRVRGHYYTHKVLATNMARGVLIGNNHGGVNGWTKQVYGRVLEVLPMSHQGE